MLREDLKALGCPDQDIERNIEQEQENYRLALTQWQKEMQKHQVLVWPENWKSVQLFLDLSADWIKPGAMGGGYRLPTTEIAAAMRISGIKHKKARWKQLQLMKAHAAGILTQKYNEAQHAA